MINLTTGTTEPPADVEPLSGSEGIEFPPMDYYGARRGRTSTATQVAARSVDNTFGVPGANDCDTLSGLGFADTPLASAVNLDSLINSQVGLPAPAGENHMLISVDSDWAWREVVWMARGQDNPVDFIAWPVRFGAVEVGTSSDAETLTLRNVISDPLAIPAAAGLLALVPHTSQFEIIDDRCAGKTLEQGEQCEVDMQFTPTSVGEKSTSYVANPTSFFTDQFGAVGGTGVDG